MSQDIKIPSVGESISGGVISAWHKNSGDAVRAGEALLTLDTDKVSTEIPSPSDGILEIKVQAGQEVKVGEVVGALAKSGTPQSSAAAPPPAQTPAPATPGSAAETAAPERGQPAADLAESAPTSPSVRRILEEEKLSVSDIPGSGKGGRITKDDVLDYLRTKESQPESPAPVAAPSQGMAAPSVSPAPSSATEATSPDGRTTHRRLSPIRRKIAEQLVHAQHSAAILTTFNECDLTAVMDTRKRLQDEFQKAHGVKLGMMSFFIKAVVSALKAVPQINGRIEGDDFVQNHFYDIGVAVGTDRGLMVPVIRDADTKSFSDLEKDLADFAVRARDAKIKLDELRGGVFSISNGGVYGSLLSTPILNPPQSGILGMHTIQQRPVAIDGQVVIRPMMYLALSYDHRVVDGREAVNFLVHVKKCVEDPVRLTLG